MKQMDDDSKYSYMMQTIHSQSFRGNCAVPWQTKTVTLCSASWLDGNYQQVVPPTDTLSTRQLF